jgi:hypothetical protein
MFARKMFVVPMARHRIRPHRRILSVEATTAIVAMVMVCAKNPMAKPAPLAPNV